MELHRMKKAFHLNMDEDKHQMLNLNSRLEAYLSRVKHLEEENALLAKEIQGMRYNNMGAQTHRKTLEEELRQTRLAVDEAWRDRVLTEFEVNQIAKELELLDLQRQSEAQARMRAKTELDKSRKELEEEQRAQTWLRQKVTELEQEVKFLIQNHQEDVAHLTTQMTHSKLIMPQRVHQTQNLLQLGEEYSQRATRAWHEAAETYQLQLSRMEESLDQARGRLFKVEQEKQEIQLELGALEKEINSEHEVRQHLEKTVAQQRDQHGLGIQQLQEHLQGLEAEKEMLGRQIDQLHLENQGLLQLKMSLGLEVTTYRALLENGSLREDISFRNQPRNITVAEAAFSPLGVKKYQQAKPSASNKTTSLSSLRYTSQPIKMVYSSSLRKRSEAPNEHLHLKRQLADQTDIATHDTSYPKILEAAVNESFRRQEACEKVRYTEPSLLPQKEKEREGEGEPFKITSEDESDSNYQMKAGLTKQPYIAQDVTNPQLTTFSIKPYQVKMTEEVLDIADQSEKDPPEETNELLPLNPGDSPISEKYIKDMEDREESSDSETEAMIEQTCGSSQSSDNKQEVITENVLNENANEGRQEKSLSIDGTRNADDKLYPDGEEMDTWDSVMERKIDPEDDDDKKNIEKNRKHAEPEEDISARECRRIDYKQSLTTNEQPQLVQVHYNKVSEIKEFQDSYAGKDQEDEEDSENVSVSWRTELESDSYAQENTLADTRPLIRYKSDETDIHMQVSNADESESSEGEQDRKVGLAWGEEKSNRFGTMEDLCEEVEGEMLDEEYYIGYINPEERDEEVITVVSEDFKQGLVVETQEAIVNEGHANEENNNLKKTAKAVYDEELDTDKLVEQELENFTTDSYSTYFAEHQTHQKMMPLMEKKQSELDKSEPSKTEDNSGQNEIITLAHLDKNIILEDCSVVIPKIATVAEEDISRGDQQIETKIEGVNEHSVSMVTEMDGTETPFDISDISRNDTKEVKFLDDPQPLLRTKADQVFHCSSETEEPVHVDTYTYSHKNDVADCQQISGSSQPPPPQTEVSKESHTQLIKEMGKKSVFPQQQHQLFADESKLQEYLMENIAEKRQITHKSIESQGHLKEHKKDEFSGTQQYQMEDMDASETSEEHPAQDTVDFVEEPETQERIEWEVLENQSHSTESRDHVSESADEMHLEEPVNDKEQIKVKVSTEGDNSGLFSSGLEKPNSLASSLYHRTTAQPDLASDETAEYINRSNDNQVWGDLIPQSGVNGNSQVDVASFTNSVTKEQEEMLSEVQKPVARQVVEEGQVHSAESESKAESCSFREQSLN